MIGGLASIYAPDGMVFLDGQEINLQSGSEIDLTKDRLKSLQDRNLEALDLQFNRIIEINDASGLQPLDLAGRSAGVISINSQLINLSGGTYHTNPFSINPNSPTDPQSSATLSLLSNGSVETNNGSIILLGTLTPADFQIVNPGTIVLSTTPVPIPSAILLFTSAVLAMFGWSRQHKFADA